MNGQQIALDHYNRSARARRADDFDVAIAELDACLCSHPHPLLEALAWFNLGEIVFLNFDFANRHSSTLSDDEYYWSIRAGEANLRAIEAMGRCSQTGVSGSEAMVRDAQKAYEKAQTLDRFFASYDPYIVRNGRREYRPDIVFRNVTMSPLRCLAEFEENARKMAAGVLKFNGLYFKDDLGTHGYSRYLRFYDDGEVIRTFSNGTPEDVVRWFDRNHPSTDKGRYELQGRNIQFVLNLSSGGTDAQSGVVLNDSLQLIDSIGLHYLYQFFPEDPLISCKRILGIDGEITEASLKEAYRKAIAKYHPDKVQHLGDEFKRLAGQRASEINDAYEYLRKKYSFN